MPYLGVAAALEKFHRDLAELRIGEDILLLLVPLAHLRAHLIQLRLELIRRTAGDLRLVTDDLLDKFRIDLHRVAPYSPRTKPLNSLVTILYRSPEMTLNTA